MKGKPLINLSMADVTTPFGIMIAVALTVLVVFIVFKKVIPNLSAIVAEVKTQLFTTSGIISSFVHLMILVGVLSSWVMFNIKVLGHDVSVSTPVYDER